MTGTGDARPLSPYAPLPCSRPVPPGSRIVLGHRGAPSLAPENTLASIRRAARAGASWVEIDVDVIGDGTPIVIHDSSLDRTTDRTGSYYDLSRAELEDIDAGSWFIADDGSRPYAGERLPTLARALEAIAAEGLSVIVEMKPCEAGPGPAQGSSTPSRSTWTCSPSGRRGARRWSPPSTPFSWTGWGGVVRPRGSPS